VNVEPKQFTIAEHGLKAQKATGMISHGAE